MHQALASGTPFPKITVPLLGGGQTQLGTAKDWALVVVYRGLHCPKCKDYLRALDALLPAFADLRVTVTAVSSDPVEKAKAFVDEISYSGQMAYGLSVTNMRQLGLYISEPLSEAETDRPFAEPGLFLINDAGRLQVHDISTAPWAPPPLQGVVDGIAFVRKMGRPPRGTY